MKKKAFSLSELMVALSIMAVLSAILIPSLTKSLPNDDKYKFKTAYGILANTVNELINDTSLYPLPDMTNPTDSTYFCRNMAAKLNTINAVNCQAGDPTTYPNDFQTSNGVVWAGVGTGGGFASTPGGENRIRIDLNGDDLPNVDGEDRYLIDIYPTGKLVVKTQAGIDYLKED